MNIASICVGGDANIDPVTSVKFPAHGQIIPVKSTKFPHPGLHKAEPKKGTMKISPNKTLQSLFMNVVVSPRIHLPVTAAIIYFNHNPRSLRIIQKPFRRNSKFYKFKYTILSKLRVQRKSVLQALYSDCNE